MTLKVTGFTSSGASYKIVNDADSDENAESDVLGTSGSIYSVDITNSAGTHTSYVKFKLTSGTATVGTTEPDMMLVCGPSTSERYMFPAGLSFSQLTFWTARNAATTDTTAPNSTTVNILCS